jgi:hypothetical protein
MVTPPSEWPVMTRMWLFQADPPMMTVDEGDVGGAVDLAVGVVGDADDPAVGVVDRAETVADRVATAVGVVATSALGVPDDSEEAGAEFDTDTRGETPEVVPTDAGPETLGAPHAEQASAPTATRLPNI